MLYVCIFFSVPFQELQALVREAIEDERPTKEIVVEVKEAMGKTAGITEHDAVVMVSACTCLGAISHTPSFSKNLFVVMKFYQRWRSLSFPEAGDSQDLMN